MSPDLDRARDALFACDPSCSREKWVKLAMAAKAGGLSFEDFDEWSRLGVNYSEADALRMWRSIEPDGGVTAGTLFKEAMEQGWRSGANALGSMHRPALRKAISRPAEHRQRRMQDNGAAAAWSDYEPASAAHPYIVHKNGEPGELRVVPEGSLLRIRGEPMAGALVIPAYPEGNAHAAPLSLQFIPPPEVAQRLKSRGESTKLNLPGASFDDGWFVVGDALDDGVVVYLCEGIGQAWACWRATGRSAVVCFGWGRVRRVAARLRQQFPDAVLVLVPDVGKESSAEAIAQEVGAQVVALPPGHPQNYDVNDYARDEGVDALEVLLEPMTAPASAQVTAEIETGSPVRGPWGDVRDGTERTRPLTELGNAYRLADEHGARLRYVPERDGWLLWRDGSWGWCSDGSAVRTLAAKLPQRIYDEGSQYMKEGRGRDGEHFARWGRKSQEEKTIRAAASLLTDFADIRLPLAQVDADPMLCGLDGGRQVLDLRTGTARLTQPADFITKSLNVASLGDAAKAVRWQQFLAEVFCGDKALIDWIQRWCGYVLTGLTTEQVLVFFFGGGANGKSVLVDVLRHIMGDYGRALAPETLTESRRNAGAPTPDLALLPGVRLAMSTETEDGVALAESLVKTMTGGDALTARALYRAQFDFMPAFKLLMVGNHKPLIKGTDHGIWRRIRLVPFLRTFSAQERDPGLAAKLKEEGPHIIAWMVAGCLAWQQKGLANVPEVVAAQTQEYREEMDTVGQWLGEFCVVSAGRETLVSELYDSYREWAEKNGLKPMSNIALGRRLGDRGFSGSNSNGVRRRHGLALRSRLQSVGFNGAYARIRG